MILGTSKILIFFGPIIGHFWARRPCICGLSYTKIPQKILESIWEHPGKNIIYGNMTLKKFENFRPVRVYHFSFCFFYF